MNKIHSRRRVESSLGAFYFCTGLIQKASIDADNAIKAIYKFDDRIIDFLQDVCPDEYKSLDSLSAFWDDAMGESSEGWRSYDAQDGVSKEGNFNPSGIGHPDGKDRKSDVLTRLANVEQYCKAALKFIETFAPEDVVEFWTETLTSAMDAASNIYDIIKYDEWHSEDEELESTKLTGKYLAAALESFAPRRKPAQRRRVESRRTFRGRQRRVEDWNEDQVGRINGTQRDLVSSLNELYSEDSEWLNRVYAVADFLKDNDATGRVLRALQGLLIEHPEDVDTAEAYDLSEVLEDALDQFSRANPRYDRPDVEPEQESRRTRRYR